MTRPYFLRIKSDIAISIFPPATLTLCWATIPPRLIIATSVVPSPISTIRLPAGAAIGTLAPIAAATGALTMYTRLAPALIAASITARLSVEVIPVGTLIISSGLRSRIRPAILLIRYLSSAWVMR